MRTAAYVDNRERLNIKSRKSKYKKLLAVLEKKVNLKKTKVLDIGTSSGYIQSMLSTHVKELTSVDVIDERREKKGYKFIQVKTANLPFKDEEFDLVITSHVIEHIPDQKMHIDEIHRVLKKSGVVYLATPSKYSIVEPHYRLLFLSWLPRGLASAYLRLSDKTKSWNIYPVSRRKLKELTNKKFEIEDEVPNILKNPKGYSLDVGGVFQKITTTMPKAFLIALSRLSPTIIVVMKKNN